MKNMTLVSIVKNGLHEVMVVADGKPYTYYLESEYAVNKFLAYYHKEQYGKAINVLNKHNERRDLWETKK